MSRPKKCRNIAQNPDCYNFKPAGVSFSEIDEIELSLDEYEAIRLADLENMNMLDGATSMGVSAPTFNRILQSAHNKIAQAIVNVRSIKICKCEKN